MDWHKNQLIILFTTFLIVICLKESLGINSRTSWQVADVPNPQTEPDRCGVSYLSRSFICDPNILVSNESVEIMARMISMTYNDTRGACNGRASEGYIVSVALLHDIYDTDGLSGYEQRLAADDFARTLRNSTWRFGACGNDVVIVVSAIGETVGVAMGEKARIRLTSEVNKRIVDEAISRLNQHNIDVETIWLLSNFYDYLTNTMEAWEPYRIFAITFAGILGAALALLIIYLIVYCCVYVERANHKHRVKRRALANLSPYEVQFGRHHSRGKSH